MIRLTLNSHRFRRLAKRQTYNRFSVHQTRWIQHLSIPLSLLYFLRTTLILFPSTATWASASSLYPGHLDASSPSQALEADDYGPALAHDIFNVGTIVRPLPFFPEAAPADRPCFSSQTSRLLFDRNLALDGTGGGAKMEHTLAALFPGEEWPEQLVYGYGVDREPCTFPCSISSSLLLSPALRIKTDSSSHRAGTNLDSDGKCLPTLRQRIEATGKVTDPKEAEQLHSFLKACWTLNSYKRPSAKEVLKHVWLREEQKP